MKYQISYWEYDSFLKDIDVAIIGSGIVGLSAAIHLKTKHPNMHVVIIERGTLPKGASTRNAGFACIGSMTELMDDLETRSESEVFGLVQKRHDGLNLLRSLLGDKKIKYDHCGGYEVFKSKDQNAYSKCIEHIEYFNVQMKTITGHPETFKALGSDQNFGLKNVSHYIFNQAEGSIHTGEMMHSLLKLAREKGVHFLNGLNVERIQVINNQLLINNSGGIKIATKKLIIANNGFAKQLLPQVKLSPARNQVILTSPIKKLKLKGTFHAEKGYVYFRNINNRVLIGGFRHLNEKEESTEKFGSTEVIQNALIDMLDQTILSDQEYTIDYKWSGIMGIGESKLPIVEEAMPNTIAAIRLGGMGVAIGCLVGKEAAEKLL